MSKPEQFGVRGQCLRCGGTSKEWLEFSSKHKSTRIELCDDCFQLFRSTFVDLIREPAKCTKD